MATFRLVPADEWDTVIGTLRGALALLEKVGNEGTLDLPKAPTPSSASVEPMALPAADRSRPYTIGRGSWSYVDVWLKEMPVDLMEFSLEQAWSGIKDLIYAKGKRPRDGLRIALDRDPRFGRVQERQGVRWSLVAPE